MQAICILLGVPEADRHSLARAVNVDFDIREGDSPSHTTGDGTFRRTCSRTLTLIAAKREVPTDDMLSTMVHATLDDVHPPALSDVELFSFLLRCCSPRLRDHAQRHRRRAAGAAGAPRPARRAAARSRSPSPRRSRRCCAGRPPPRPSGAPPPARRLSVSTASRRATRSSSGRISQPRRTGLRAVDGVRHEAGSEPAHLLRPRHPLLPRRQPGTTRDAGGVRGARCLPSPPTSW